jgi:hypothetical protein
MFIQTWIESLFLKSTLDKQRIPTSSADSSRSEPNTSRASFYPPLPLLVKHIDSMIPRSRLALRNLSVLQKTAAKRKMSTFTIPIHDIKNNAASTTTTTTTIPVNFASSSDLISRDQLLSFPAFKTWLSTLQRSLARQRHPTHEFHRQPYALRKIDIQAVDRWGGRIGFVKFVADVSNDSGESFPGSVFLRGGSVGMLVSSTKFPLPPKEGKS